MFKIIKKILIGILSLLLAFVLLWVGVVHIPYPRYKKNQSEMVIADNVNANEIKVMSYTIRCHAPDDMGEKNWFNRAHLVADTIEKAQPGIIGFQEVNSWQYDYLCETMPAYDSIITYRDNIPLYSEGCPVFYRTDLYSLLDKGSFWLSETPEEMSKDWGAACYRICSYAKLKDNATGKEFIVFNAHLDHVSDEARINGINVVLDKIKEFGGVPAVLPRDFNAEETSDTYKSTVEYFDDTKYMTENTMKSCTYQSWGTQLDRECIDYIMVSKSDFKVHSYKVITDTYDGVYTSDHFPIISTISFE
jgi:endonuclease/exonuclease/phosphatase family metal-dependent hydrolase